MNEESLTGESSPGSAARTALTTVALIAVVYTFGITLLHAWTARTVYFVGVTVMVAVHIARVRSADDRAVRLLAEHREVERERGQLTAALAESISRDVLTGLANREAFLAQLQEELRAERVVAVLFIDLDDFKNVNDTLGHAVGDELIICVAERLLTGSRQHDIVARFGGDEFAVLLTDLDRPAALRVAQRLLAELKSPFSLCGRTVAVRASGGLAVSDGRPAQAPEQRALELLRQADLAMYASKAERTHSVTLYHDAMQTDMVERLSLESDMHHAIAGQDFQLVYQPIVNMREGSVVAVEALMRWQHPSRGSVPPSSFVPVAEQTGMIVPLTLWVIREACAQLRAWDEHDDTAGLSMAVNMSGRLMSEPGIGSAIARELHRALIDPHRLVLEITESLLMEDRSYAIQTLCQLRALGTRLSVDDFGTGYSSLSRLNKLPIDEVKIDQSFVCQLEHGDAGRTIVQASVAMAHGLGLRVVAEGVETERQVAMLRQMGCDEAQGYYFGRPSPAEQATRVLREWVTTPAAAVPADLPRQAGRSWAEGTKLGA